jgi:alpha-1,2-mannosyltransferase
MIQPESGMFTAPIWSCRLMRGILDFLRTGDWLTRERTRLIAFAMLIGSVIALTALVVKSDNYLDWRGHPIGTDFANVYAAGTFVLEGRPEAPFDPVQHHDRQRAIFGAEAPFYGWHYPPFFLFPAAALALLPYGLALAVWLAITFLLYLIAMRAILAGQLTPPGVPGAGNLGGQWWLLFAAAFPAVLVNAGHGQNGFLTAALIGGALLLLDRRPGLAGMLFGLLSYKPQFGLLIPLVLLATQRWRAFSFAALTVAALAAVSTLAFSPQIWGAFLASTEFSRVVVLEDGNTGWQKIQSVFSWIRMWGGSVSLAYALHAALVAILCVVLVRLWRSDHPYQLKAGALIIASILSTPYALDYDMMVLAPAIAFLAIDGLQRGFAPWQRTALALLWMAPAVARSLADATYLPIGVWAMIAVLLLFVRDPADRATVIIAPASKIHSAAV